MSHPDGLPELFLDRSLGRVKVPRLLREARLKLTTLAEHYGVPHDELVDDREWLQLAGSRGWVVFLKDTRIRHNPAERAAVLDHGVRCFCLSKQGLDAEEMARRFLKNLDAIVDACVESGPFIYVVQAKRLERRTILG